MAQLFSNNLSTVLSNSVTTLDTTLPITPGTGNNFPVFGVGDFMVGTLIGITGVQETSWEVVKITGATANTLTVERAQEGTVAVAWASGVRLEIRLTAGSADRFEAGYNDDISSASFNTNTGVVTLTPRDGADVTVDLDGRYHEIGTDIPNADISQSSVTQHQAALSVTESQISDLASYEPAFVKNTGFNKSFGTAVGTVAEGNHTHPAADIDSGTFADARIAASNVTQHEAALSITESQISDFGSYVTTALLGANSGVATLDAGGIVPAGQLPSYVDDVVEAANFAALPGTGEAGKIYITLDNNEVYRWTGSVYVEINTSVGSADTAVALATPRNFGITGDVTAPTIPFDGSGNVSFVATVPQASITQHQAAISITESQISDLGAYATVVYVDGKTWDWATDITAKPTTLAGYGITDAATSAQGANADTAHGWGNHAIAGYLTTVSFAGVTGKPTTLAGYGITDAATAAQGTLADTAVQPNTSPTFTAVQLGNWDIELDGNDLRFQYNGTDVMRITTTGNVIALGDVSGGGAP